MNTARWCTGDGAAPPGQAPETRKFILGAGEGKEEGAF